jgi:hypothetical protein
MRDRSVGINRVLPRLFGAGASLTTLAPTTASAHGFSDEFVAVVTSAILVLHTAAIAGAILCLRRRRSWPVAGVVVLIAAAASVALWLGFVKLARLAAEERVDLEWLFWVWVLAPFALLVLSVVGLVCRRYLKRAV